MRPVAIPKGRIVLPPQSRVVRVTLPFSLLDEQWRVYFSSSGFTHI